MTAEPLVMLSFPLMDALLGTEQDRDCQRYHTFYAQDRDVVRLVRYNVLTLP